LLDFLKADWLTLFRGQPGDSSSHVLKCPTLCFCSVHVFEIGGVVRRAAIRRSDSCFNR